MSKYASSGKLRVETEGKLCGISLVIVVDVLFKKPRPLLTDGIRLCKTKHPITPATVSESGAKRRATGNEDDKTADRPSAKKRSRQANDVPDDLTSIETSCIGTGSQTTDSLIDTTSASAHTSGDVTGIKPEDSNTIEFSSEENTTATNKKNHTDQKSDLTCICVSPVIAVSLTYCSTVQDEEYKESACSIKVFYKPGTTFSPKKRTVPSSENSASDSDQSVKPNTIKKEKSRHSKVAVSSKSGVVERGEQSNQLHKRARNIQEESDDDSMFSSRGKFVRRKGYRQHQDSVSDEDDKEKTMIKSKKHACHKHADLTDDSSDGQTKRVTSRDKGKAKASYSTQHHWKWQRQDDRSDDESSEEQDKRISYRDKGKAKQKVSDSSDEDTSLDGFIVRSADENSSDDKSDGSNDNGVDDNPDGLVTVQSEVPFDSIMGSSYDDFPVTYYRFVEPMANKNYYCHIAASLSDIHQIISRPAWKLLKKGLNFVKHYPFVNPGHANWRLFKKGLWKNREQQVGLEVISGEFELSAGFIGGMFGLGKDFATCLVNFEAQMDLPSHLVYATCKNIYMGSRSKRRHNPYMNSSKLVETSTFKGRAGGTEDLVILNVLFVILLAKGSTEEERVEEHSPAKIRHYTKPKGKGKAKK
ncbi:hypothetical protein ARMGADRAFT_1022655 [Armillaria gallica]|uniref:Uncharacterized protein n=1 Tax=Armillaria gallica TaxID=47427 RepID=A0A2H3ED59_ARMGA|nr:hypothetical protein ARMGADRAFT_1022655 [Armillaria gallica]